MEDQGVQSPQTLLVKNFSFLQLPGKHDDRCAFKLNSTFGMIGKATADKMTAKVVGRNSEISP